MNTSTRLAKEPVTRLFFMLALPQVAGQVINMLYNIVDRIFVGHIPVTGSIAITGMGVSMPLIILVSAFSSLIGMGGSPLASIRMGENNHEEAERILGSCFLFSVIISFVLTVIVLLFKRPILYFFGASDQTILYALEYSTIYILGTFFVQTTLGLNAFISAQGYSMVAMKTILIGAVLNIMLDPILIFTFQMGIQGAAIATVFSQAVSCIWVLKFITSEKSTLRLKKEYFKWDNSIIKRVLQLGMSPFIMQSTESLLNIVLNKSLLKYGGDIYVGAMAILATLSQMIMLPMTGLTQGSQPIISYNYGAKNYDRVRKAFRVLLITGFIYVLIFYLVCMISPQVLIKIFTDDIKLIKASTWAIRIYMFGYFIFSVQVCCQQTFIALGQAKISIFLALLRKIILLIPLIYILPLLLQNKVFAVFVAEPIADITAGIVTATMFYRYFKNNMEGN